MTETTVASEGLSTRKAGYPKGLPYILGNEAAERFSFYGMRTILVFFMTHHLLNSHGQLAPMSNGQATVWYHLFTMANNFFPILGGLLADVWWGKYRTILVLSIIYCFGHLALALEGTSAGLFIGLTLIAIGAGGIKPCVSSHLGDQFSRSSSALLAPAFAYFYVAINLGGFISSMITPALLERYGHHVAFGVPGLLMLAATILFRAGRKRFVAVPPVGWRCYRALLLSREGMSAIIRLAMIYGFVALFYALFDQTGSTWVLQAEHMDRVIRLGQLRFEILPSQVQSLNPVLILLLAPLVNHCVYPIWRRFSTVTYIQRLTAGLVLAGVAFGIVATAQTYIAAGERVSIIWQAAAFGVMTLAEVFVAITALEFAYTQAPQAMKSLIMSFYLLSASLGNGFTAIFNWLILDKEGGLRLSQDHYFWVFAVFVWIVSGLLYLTFRKYQEKRFLTD